MDVHPYKSIKHQNIHKCHHRGNGVINLESPIAWPITFLNIMKKYDNQWPARDKKITWVGARSLKILLYKIMLVTCQAENL